MIPKNQDFWGFFFFLGFFLGGGGWGVLENIYTSFWKEYIRCLCLYIWILSFFVKLLYEGHGKQGGWHMYTEESGHGYVPSRSGDKMLEDEGCRLSFSRGDGKYGRSSREIRFSQRDWKGHSWETGIGSPNTPVGL